MRLDVAPTFVVLIEGEDAAAAFDDVGVADGQGGHAADEGAEPGGGDEDDLDARGAEVGEEREGAEGDERDGAARGRQHLNQGVRGRGRRVREADLAREGR